MDEILFFNKYSGDSFHRKNIKDWMGAYFLVQVTRRLTKKFQANAIRIPIS